MSIANAFIQFQGVWKRYHAYPDHHDALKEINLEIERDSVTFVTGHSGAGKSTFFKLIALMERPTRGRIIVGGHDLGALSRWSLPSYRRNLGIVLQEPKLLNDRNIADNIALGLIIRGYRREEIKQRTERALSVVKMSSHAGYYPLSLSAGQRQRVGLARALAGQPRILLADEPTGNLDPGLSAEIMELLFVINKNHCTCVLIATHEAALVKKFARNFQFRNIELREGMLKQ